MLMRDKNEMTEYLYSDTIWWWVQISGNIISQWTAVKKTSSRTAVKSI